MTLLRLIKTLFHLFQCVPVASRVLPAFVGAAVRHVPRDPLQLRARPDRDDSRGAGRLRGALLLPHVRGSGKNGKDGGRGKVQGRKGNDGLRFYGL